MTFSKLFVHPLHGLSQFFYSLRDLTGNENSKKKLKIYRTVEKPRIAF